MPVSTPASSKRYSKSPKEGLIRRIVTKIGLWFASAEKREKKKLEKEWAELRDVRLSISYKELCDELNPIEMGRENGVNKNPPSESETYDQFHIDLIETAQQKISQQAGLRSNVLRDRSLLMMQIDFGNTKPELNNILRRFSDVNVPKIIEKTRSEVISKFSDYESSLREYNYFKSVNQRIAEAKPPTNSLLMGIIFMMLIIIEGLPNLYFLRDALPFGIFAAGFLSLIIVLINSGFSYVIGSTLFKRLNYVDRFKRKRWIASIFILLSFTLLLGLLSLTANARTFLEAYSQWPDSADNSLILSLTYWTGNPRSTAMFAVGFLSILIGTVVGYLTTGDTYPGYWAKRREVIKYLTKYEKLVESIRQQIRYAKDKADTDFHNLAAVIEKKFIRFSDLRAQYSDLVTRHLDEFNRAEEIVQMVAHSYRTQNIQHRGASPAPTYFRSVIRLRRPPMEPLDDVDKRYDDLKNQLTESNALIVKYQSLMQDQFSNEMKKLETEIHKSQGIAKDNINKSAPALNAAQVAAHSP